MSKVENTVKWLKGQRISWIGHLERMEEDRMHKKSSLINWKGREERGDPGKMERGSRKRSLSAGSEKMELVADRKKWKDIVRQAKAHSGL